MTEAYLNFEEKQDFKPHSFAKMFKWHTKKNSISNKWLPVLIANTEGTTTLHTESN